jgi:electron-transferring-flavoprotein dehydrogenase
VRKYLEGGKRIAYGARALSEGGLQSVPKLHFPGGVLLGDSAGLVNLPRIKGSHNAMKSGMMAAEAAFAAIQAGRSGDELVEYGQAFRASWVRKELHKVRNFKPLLGKFGSIMVGSVVGMFDLWCANLLGGFSFFGTLHHKKTDAESTGLAKDYKPIVYPKPDGVISFDKLSSVFLSNTNHDENQPAHLRLKDPTVPIASNLPRYGEPARLYCPAGVYEVLYDDNGQNPRFQINVQNCVHCKTCDIKDPAQNIVWTTPQGGDGPNYPNM